MKSLYRCLLNHVVVKMRNVILLCVFSLLFIGVSTGYSAAKESQYSKRDILSFANILFEGRGPNFGRWNGPIVYKIVGLNNPEHVKLLSSVLEYYSSLTGLEVIPHKEGKVNFVVILTDNYGKAASIPEVQRLLKNTNETVDEFISRISKADDHPQEVTEFAARHLDDQGNTVGYYLLDNPSRRKGYMRNYFMEMVSRLFLEYNPNNFISPSIFNAKASVGGFWSKPARKLPRLDEILFQEIYRMKGSKVTDAGYRRFIENTASRIAN